MRVYSSPNTSLIIATVMLNHVLQKVVVNYQLITLFRLSHSQFRLLKGCIWQRSQRCQLARRFTNTYTLPVPVRNKMVDTIVDQYKSVAQISDLKKAQILNVSESEDEVAMEVTWSARNLAAMERTLTTCDYIVRGGTSTSFFPVPVHKNVILSQHSPSGKRSAYICTSEKEKDSESLLVVERNGSAVSYDLKAADKHGKVYADGEFSCLEWSSDETKLLYVAEKKRPKPSSFFARPKSEDDDTRGQEFEFIDDWGEQLEGKHQSIICTFDITKGEIKCHTLPDELCAGQLIWTPDDSGIFGVAFVTKPYRLGLIYCPNRESKLFHMDLEGNYNEISSGYSNIRTPRVSPDGSKIAFLRTAVGGPHCKSSQLCILSWPSKEEKVVIDVIPREIAIEEGYKFKGFYGNSGISRRCWLKDSKRLAFSTYKFDSIVSYVVNIVSGAITELPYLGSHSVLDIYKDWLLVNFSHMCHPSQILLGKIPGEGQERSIKFTEVTERRDVEGIPNHYYSQWSFVNDTPHPDPKYSDIPVTNIYYGPTSLQEGEAKRPLICWPHGGPHACMTNTFSLLPTFFVKLGYSVVFTNYRGSIGFGEDGVNSLPGYCGTVDVSDVHKGTLSCLQRFKNVLDPNRVFLFGGSHGGFLVTQLAGQYPDFYKAVGARNPVTDISGMANVTDIPDWTFVETGYSFEHGKVPDAAVLSKMYTMSPISHIEKIKAPILFFIGKNDRRCPPSCGIYMHKMLLARGVDTKLNLYDDCHPLSKVDVEIDVLVHSALWFEKYRNK